MAIANIQGLKATGEGTGTIQLSKEDFAVMCATHISQAPERRYYCVRSDSVSFSPRQLLPSQRNPHPYTTGQTAAAQRLETQQANRSAPPLAVLANSEIIVVSTAAT